MLSLVVIDFKVNYHRFQSHLRMINHHLVDHFFTKYHPNFHLIEYLIHSTVSMIEFLTVFHQQILLNLLDKLFSPSPSSHDSLFSSIKCISSFLN